MDAASSVSVGLSGAREMLESLPSEGGSETDVATVLVRCKSRLAKTRDDIGLLADGPVKDKAARDVGVLLDMVYARLANQGLGDDSG